MPVELGWYEENYILYSKYTGNVTLEELRTTIREATKIVLGHPHPVPHIIDVREMTSVHTNLKDFSDIGADLKGVDKRNWVIIVGITGIPKFIATMITHMAGLNCKMAASIEEAQTFAKHVMTLHNTPVED
jgi:hypothetical protein